jgi:hypothetical protein
MAESKVWQGFQTEQDLFGGLFSLFIACSVRVMNWIRTKNREWQSDCGRYRIHALPWNSGYEYAAMWVESERRVHGLGIFRSDNSVNNANAAKFACERHQRKITCS